ncbi:MAG TPA: hypothetical protein VFR34_01005, partial [Paracoccaceae bacterium]|nr:hypothetical protein [Paracoccaceae bacterium]
ILRGGADADHFAFSAGDGADLILDFEDGIDRFDLRTHDGVAGFGDVGVEALAGGVVLHLGADEVTVLGLSAGAVGEEDFLF